MHRSLQNHTTSAALRSVMLVDVEKVPNIIKEPYLAFLHREALAQDNHPIGSLALRRPIVELGHMFALQPDVSIPFLHDDLLFYILRSLAPLSAQRLLLSASKHTPEPAIKAFSDLYQIRHRVDPKGKSDSLFRPAVEMRSQGKIRIPSQTDPIKSLDAPTRSPDRSMERHRHGKRSCPDG